MEWKSLKNNYHVKYEDYFLFKNEKIILNKEKYKIINIYIGEENIIEDEVFYNNYYHPALLQKKVEIYIQLKPKTEDKKKIEIEFEISTFNTIGKNELISLKYKDNKIDEIINGVIVKDYSTFIAPEESKPFWKVELFINYYSCSKKDMEGLINGK